MAITNSVDDYQQLNDSGTQGDWTGGTNGDTVNFDAPTLNDTNATTPIYVENVTCMFWPLKSNQTGYTYTNQLPATVDITDKVVVGMLNYPFADIDNIPITALALRIGADTTFTNNFREWNALTQISAPENIPISGFTPVMGWYSGGTETGTFVATSVDSCGYSATTGATADGKQGGFDHFFAIGYIGAHSQTFTDTFFTDLYNEWYDNGGGGLPGTTDRPVPVISESGDFYQTNVRFALGDGTSDTANIVVTETGKTVFFNNLETDHELGYLFTNPASTNEIRFTLTNCVHLWNDQASTLEIFDGIANVDHFKIDGCSFSRGGKVSLPADTANRWVRGSSFNDCQAGTISDGEFTNNIVSNGEAFTVSGDADLTGTQFLTPAVAADASALVWNGNFDPDGNLDGMTFSKGTAAHHAIEFGISTPTTMTLRNMDFSGFNASNAQNDSTLHIKRTSGTVTINVIGSTGNISYKSDGATVTLVIAPVTTLVHVDDNDGISLDAARVLLEAADGLGDFPYQESVSITRSVSTATVTHTGHGLKTNDWVVIRGATQQEYNGSWQITVTTVNAYTFTVPGTPATPATGSPVSSGAIISGLTDIAGDISVSRTFSTSTDVEGVVRKSSTSPFFKSFPISGTIDNSAGLTINVRMILDE